MVFPSVPVYLNPPNWQQQHTPQPGVIGNENPQLRPLPPPPPPHVGGPGGGSGSSIRPGSMSERARMAKIPQPEPGLKCPRCESTNTKFCYFNNYSLSQPRHFCKSCRRYWTRGGALRNVPVGGGCRRNKRSKGNNSSKSPVSGESRQMVSSNSSSISALQSEMMGHLPHQQEQAHHHQLPFMTSLHNLTQFGVGNLGLNFSGQTSHNMGFINIGSNNSNMNQQFPLYEPQGTSLYPFQSDQGVDSETPSSMVEDRSMMTNSSSSRVSQLAPVKMEDRNQQSLNLSRSFLGATSENNQYWNGSNATWTDISGLNSASSTHLL